MPDIKVMHPDGNYHIYKGIKSLSVDSATEEDKTVKFIAADNPITLVIEGVEHVLESASAPEETDEENTYTIQIK